MNEGLCVIVFEKMNRLLKTFRNDFEIAKKLESPNSEDDLATKTAIVGFSRYALTIDWEFEHYEFVRNRLDLEYPPEVLEELGENSDSIKLFYALTLGTLLGLYRQKQIDDLEFRIGEFGVFGLIMQHLAILTERPP